MTSDDILNISRDALLPNVVVPAGLFILCALMAALTSLGLRCGRLGFAFFGAVLAAASVYAGVIYTATPLWLFALMLGCGLLVGLKPERTRACR